MREIEDYLSLGGLEIKIDKNTVRPLAILYPAALHHW